MIYFTDEKYQDNSAYIDYEKYCRSIWDDLPISLRIIQGDMLPEEMFNSLSPYSLHDSLILFYRQKDGLTLSIGTEYENNWIVIELNYKNGQIIKIVPVQRLTNTPEDPDNDIMCHELIKSGDNRYTHTYLFAGGEELQISFSELDIIK